MGWTKRDFIRHAFSSIGLSTEEYDIDDSEWDLSLEKLEAMIGAWGGKGIRIGYPIAAQLSNANLDAETGVPTSANEAVYLNLALRLAPGLGKVVSEEIKSSAKMAYRVMINAAIDDNIPRKSRGWDVPSGAGNKYWRTGSGPFLDGSDEDPLELDSTGKLQFRSK